jgi:nucleoside 2-deoxyribosyltransferase
MFGDREMAVDSTCILCDSACKEINDSLGFSYIECLNCGRYSLARSDKSSFHLMLKNQLGNKLHLISGYIRESSNEKSKPIILNTESVNVILKNSNIPQTINDNFNKLLIYLNNRTEYLGHYIEYEEHPAIAYALNIIELRKLILALEKNNYAKIFYKSKGTNNSDGIFGRLSLTIDGIKEADRLLKYQTESNNAFIAMWFDDEMIKIFDDHISKAVEDAGYRALIISQKEHNDDICDQIIAEIRKCKFLIADFTGNREGVYYEAGFAYGLGKEVIYTCRKDWHNQEISEEVDVTLENGSAVKAELKKNRKIHFDVDHRNFIIWETGEDLYQKLKARIGATISIK